MSGFTCPCCRQNLKLYAAHIRDRQSGQITLDFEIVSEDEIESLVRPALIGYLRWLAEGSPESCVYYDPWKENISLEGKNGSYRIQTFDSPEGDTWVRGTFELSGLNLIVTTRSTEDT